MKQETDSLENESERAIPLSPAKEIDDLLKSHCNARVPRSLSPAAEIDYILRHFPRMMAG